MAWLATIAGVLILLVGVLFPRHGLVSRIRQMRESRRRALVEDALKHLHACEWHGDLATPESLVGALGISPGAAIPPIARMEAKGWLNSASGGLRLTPEGARLALAVIRAHRLWERYLADEARMPLTAIHGEAERREHDHTPERVQALDEAMGHPAIDPHGDPIPTAEGQVARSSTKPLTEGPLNTPARIAHLEDEPALIYSQIAAEGLRPGLVVRVIEANSQCLVLSDGTKVHTLAPIVAANVFVAPEGVEAYSRPRPNLLALRVGERAIVAGLDDSLQGFTRRRLLDLGLTPGTPISAEMRSPLGDPIAYRVRGTLIALRRDQAEKVLVRNMQGANEKP